MSDTEKPVLENPIKIGPIIGLIVFFSLARGCYSSHKSDHAESGHVPLLKQMLVDKSATIAKINPSYKEVTVKIMHVPMKHYEVSYTYWADGAHSGTRTLSEPPTSLEMPIYYAKSDPDVSSFDPEADIKKIQSDASSNSNLYWSIGWATFGVLGLLGWISEIRKYRKAKKAIKDAEETAYQKAVNY
ncbi:hypothetical protein CLV59_10744 [Chitinophaga dinghuensis]|uniref:DUF3592 domain-containing protein n=1 Tax=Chitinophaga dinghuensis TaxID=1539050 RepID=A0A327VTK0_9BACT|nr:hypothetical protein [Chitinophaga dinghuensis]RAJ77278.1 hypothetical protein CLV59_10744 [Chitinophaga dinghuensis]